MDEKDESIKRMADLLRRGATMLAQACPQCGSPLLKIGDEIYCATCDRKIVYSDEQDVSHSQGHTTLPELQHTLLEKIKALNDAIAHENDLEVLTKLSNLLVLMLRALRETNNI
ncbi:MAG: Sjogren's syndrome/scleroderma autoantigen 1 family protein [Candidatus Thorarchaeota archaeon]